jgi:hypothetical protein
MRMNLLILSYKFSDTYLKVELTQARIGRQGRGCLAESVAFLQGRQLKRRASPVRVPFQSSLSAPANNPGLKTIGDAAAIGPLRDARVQS